MTQQMCLLGTPSLGPCLYDPFEYQLDFIDAVHSRFAAGDRRTVAEMFTGGGKTYLAGFICRRAVEKKKRVLVLAHRRELVNQFADKLDTLGIEPGIEMGDMRARALFEPDVVVASYQSLYKARLAQYPRDYFDLIIPDECHHLSEDSSYMEPIRWFDRARVLGLTATAFRHDGKDLGKVFQSVAKTLNIRDAVNYHSGPLVARPKARRLRLDIDLRGMRPRRDDTSLDELDARIAPRADMLANLLAREIGDRPTIVFCAGIRSSEGVANACRSMGMNAVWTSGDDPMRDEKVAAFKRGQHQIFVNCAICVEGFDYPPTACVGMFKPTESTIEKIQEAGRCLRRHGDKEYGLLLEPNWLIDKDELATTVSLVDSTDLDRDVYDEASSMAAKAEESGDLIDLVDLIEAAEKKVVAEKDKEKRREELRVQAKIRDIKYKRIEYDPVGASEVLGIPVRRTTKEAVIDRATPGQAKYLATFGVNDAPNLSKTRAKTMLDYLSSRRKAGLAEVWMVGKLLALGVDPAVARAMPKKDAQARLDQILGRQR
jgi:superfamily II DNA or RNA helicase